MRNVALTQQMTLRIVGSAQDILDKPILPVL